MKSLVIKILEPLTTLLFFAIIIFSAIKGWDYLGAGKIFGGLIGLLIGFIAAVILTGGIYLMISINDHLSHIRQKNGQ